MSVSEPRADTSAPVAAGAVAPRRWPLVLVAAIGVGLALTPALTGMFTRAPAGGQMLEDFAPFMTEARLDAFAGHLDTIGAAIDATEEEVVPVAGVDHPATDQMVQRWPGIEEQMRGMLADIRANVDRYDQVAALPPFALFPWFFVIPGVLAVGLAGIALRHSATTTAVHGTVRLARWSRIALVALGLGLVAAPFAFQMFTRAPAGAAMIDDLRPLMARDTITELQSSFVAIGAMEGEVRTRLLPAANGPPPEPVETFQARWPTVSADMAPMVGVMADNLDAFAGIDALPPFDWFPWFFVMPGVAITALAAISRPLSPPSDV